MADPHVVTVLRAKRAELITKRVGCCLRGQREIGRVTSDDGLGQTVVWRLVYAAASNLSQCVSAGLG